MRRKDREDLEALEQFPTGPLNGPVTPTQAAAAQMALGGSPEGLRQALARAKAQRRELDHEIGRAAAILFLGEIAGILKNTPSIHAFRLMPRSMDVGLQVDYGDGIWFKNSNWQDDEADMDTRPPEGWDELYEALSTFVTVPHAPEWGIHDEQWHGEPVRAGSIIELAQALGMDWALPWIEAGMLDCDTPAGRQSAAQDARAL